MAGGTKPHLTWGLNTSFTAALEPAGSGWDGCSGRCAWVQVGLGHAHIPARGPGTWGADHRPGVLGGAWGTPEHREEALCWTLLGSSRSDVAAGPKQHSLRPRPLPGAVPCTAPERSGPLLPRHALRPGARGGGSLDALFQLLLFCLLATTSSERLLRGFYLLFFTKFLFFFFFNPFKSLGRMGSGAERALV